MSNDTIHEHLELDTTPNAINANAINDRLQQTTQLLHDAANQILVHDWKNSGHLKNRKN